MNISCAIKAIVIIGLFLRLYQVSFDLPLISHDVPLVLSNDEPAFVQGAMACGTGVFNPYTSYVFSWCTVFVYILFALYVALTGIGFLLGIFRSVSDVARLYLIDYSFFYISGRILSALVGTATIYVTYRLGKSVYSKKAGLVAALLLTFFPTHVIYSHLATYDVLVTLFVLLSIWRIFQMSNADVSRNAVKYYLGTGFLVGISAVTKPSALLLIVPFAASHMLRVYGKSKAFRIQDYVFNRTLYFGLAAILLGMFIGSPFFFIEYRSGIMTYLPLYVRGQIDPNIAILRGGYLLPYITMLINQAGYPFTVVVIISLIYVITSLYWKRKQTRFNLTALSFVGAYALALAYFTRKAERDLLPIVPLLMLFVGVFIDDVTAFLRSKVPRAQVFLASLWKRLPSFFSKSLSTFAYILLVAVVLTFLVRTTLHVEREFAKLDTRNAIRDWVRQNIPPGATMAVEAGVRIDPDVETICEKIKNLETVGTEKAKHLIRAYSYHLEAGLPRPGYRLLSTTRLDTVSLFGIEPWVPEDYQIDRFGDTEYFIFLKENIDKAKGKPEERFRLPLYEYIQQNADLVKVLKPGGDTLGVDAFRTRGVLGGFRHLKGPEVVVFKRRSQALESPQAFGKGLASFFSKSLAYAGRSYLIHRIGPGSQEHLL